MRLVGQLGDEREVIPAEAVGVLRMTGSIRVGPGERHVIVRLLFVSFSHTVALMRPNRKVFAVRHARECQPCPHCDPLEQRLRAYLLGRFDASPGTNLRLFEVQEALARKENGRLRLAHAVCGVNVRYSS